MASSNINLSDTEKRVAKAEQTLQSLDPKLGELIELQKPIIHTSRTDYFAALCRSIIGQQVSVAAASTIYARFEKLTGLKPAAVEALSESDIKTIGLSRQKASYLKDLAQHFANNPEVYNRLDTQSDEEVIAELTAVKGIGVWTAQMFLVFTLTRLDVFAPDDIGLQRAMKLLYGWDKVPPKKELEKFAERWKPYRTVACWHLWKSLDNSPDYDPKST